MTADFLLELLSEEVPARMQEKACADLARLFVAEIAKAGLTAGRVATYATPRRLALIARDLPAATDPVREETKGPRASAPLRALEGFLRKTGLTREQLTERDGIIFALVEKPGRATAEVLAEAIPAIVRAFPWPKSMRWGAASASTSSLRWVRPLKGIVALLSEEIVPFAVDGIESGATTYGHRFHHPGPVTIGSADDYAVKLRACHVILDPAERRAIIADGARAAAEAAGLRLVEDAGLVAENAGLTEWPVPLLGGFDPAFLDVPREVIQLTMRANQKYFACVDGEGRLAPNFICTANIEATDGGTAIVAGNRKVLAARLADARFFWEQDLKVPLADQAKKLDRIVFHEKLGMVADKAARVAKLARWLVEEGIVGSSSPARGGGPSQGDGGVGSPEAMRPVEDPLHHPAAPDGPPPRAGEDREELAALAEQAALLCKADLVTGMVGEFPELQGIMGGYYARAEGLDPRVADAIRDHYKPVGQGDDVPTAPVTVAVSLADKLDTLVGFFAIDERPTGSKDPYALRRAALGIIRLLVDNGVRWSIADLARETRGNLIEASGKRYAIVVLDEDVGISTPVAVQPAGNQRTAFGEIFVLPNGLEPETWLDTEKGILPAFSRGFITDFELSLVLYRSLIDLAGDLVLYIGDRLAEAQKAQGVRVDLIRAVLPREFLTVDLLALFEDDVPRVRGKGIAKFRRRNWSVTDDPVEILARVKALQAFVGTGEGADLLAGYKRAANILKKEGWEALPLPTLSPEGERGFAPAEIALLAALDAAEGAATRAVAEERFEDAMAALATLRAPIDAFFAGVTVNDPDPAIRARRLALLARARDAVHRVADFSRIEG